MEAWLEVVWIQCLNCVLQYEYGELVVEGVGPMLRGGFRGGLIVGCFCLMGRSLVGQSERYISHHSCRVNSAHFKSKPVAECSVYADGNFQLNHVEYQQRLI